MIKNNRGICLNMVILKDKKKFFMPDGRKIGFTVILTILSYIQLLTDLITEPPIYKQPVFLKIFGFPTFDWLLDKPNLLVALLSPTIIWYFVSCIVFLVWDMFKEKFRIQKKD